MLFYANALIRSEYVWIIKAWFCETIVKFLLIEPEYDNFHCYSIKQYSIEISSNGIQE